MGDKFSSKFPDYNIKQLPKEISKEIASIQEISLENSCRLFKSTEDFIGVSFSLVIPLPSRGTVNNIDIREIENVFILFSLSDFKLSAPLAFSDRSDFPSEKLPHLNPVPKGYPANFCLHRGNIDEWYAEHTLSEFIERIREWLRDAAGNRLIKLGQGDFFELTRITNPIGYNIYNQIEFINSINSSYLDEKVNYAFIWYEILKNDPLISKEKHYTIKSKGVITESLIQELVELGKQINNLQEGNNSLNKINIGILLYPCQEFVLNEYFSNLPNNFAEFESWCIDFGLPIKDSIIEYFSKGYNLLQCIPITIGIRRPKPLINSEYNIEFINFLVYIGDEFAPKNNVLNPESKVFILENRKPVSLQFARELSNNTIKISDLKTLFIGAGAVGSKLILHLAKSGYNNLVIVDDDKLSPHNLIRHGLLSLSVGKNKADGLKEEISNIFYSDSSNLKIDAYIKKGQDFIRSENKLSRYKEIIDTTASNAFQLYLSDLELPKQLRCIRCEIAFDGKLGILKKEGKSRNPRLDDLNVALLDAAIDNPFLSEWLQEFRLKLKSGSFEFEEINVGVSCNSNTLKLADDIISLHSSSFSIGIKNYENSDSGFIQITTIESNPNFTMSTLNLQIGEIYALRFNNNSDWTIRIQSEAAKGIQSELIKNLPNETGGLLVGKLDAKRKIVYVTRFIAAPDDSVKMPYFFKRGTNKILEEIELIRKKSGELIDYIGEWHSHPNGGIRLSSTDMIAVNEIRSSLDKIPFPTIIVIATPNKLHPYIFVPKLLTN
jgi:hypothetical protein